MSDLYLITILALTCIGILGFCFQEHLKLIKARQDLDDVRRAWSHCDDQRRKLDIKLTELRFKLIDEKNRRYHK